MDKAVKVNLWDGRVVDVKEIAVNAEKDQYDRVFYKIQGKNGTQSFMIAFSEDMQEVIDIHNEILERLLVAQTEVLISA